MATPYRNDEAALRERKESLGREIADLQTQTSRLEALERELREVNGRLGADARRLPLLERISVASPCRASWDDMVGDDRVRLCTQCDKNVFNLSAMSEKEAERLLEAKLGKDLCVRYYQRADGTVMTEDCPVGVTRKRRKKIVLAAVGAAAAAVGATAMLATTTCTTGKISVQGGAVWQGEPNVTLDTRPDVPSANPAPPPTVPPPPTKRSAVMGRR